LPVPLYVPLQAVVPGASGAAASVAAVFGVVV
jgi:hypothetical protein